MVQVIVLARTKLKDVTCSLVIPFLIWEMLYLLWMTNLTTNLLASCWKTKDHTDVYRCIFIGLMVLENLLALFEAEVAPQSLPPFSINVF